MAEYGKSQAVSQSKDTSEEKHSNRISETEESRTQESGTSSIKTSTNIASKGKAINLLGGGGVELVVECCHRYCHSPRM